MREEARREEAAELDGEILSAIGRGWSDPLDEGEFDRLARALFAHQFRFHSVYRRFCLLRGVAAPADVRTWREIPPVPAGAFKIGRWATFPPEAETVAFRTSGTTGEGRGVHRFESLSLYNAAIVPSARRFLVPDRERIRLLMVSPPPTAAADSSLVHMLAVYREALGAPGSAFFLAGREGDGALRTEALEEALERAGAEGEPVAVVGTALGIHHALEALGPRTRPLPPGSRSMVTGGFKGVRVDADPASMADRIAERLAIPRSRQIEEYGMTELSSQHYTAELRAALGGEPEVQEPSAFRRPPWTRIRVVDPIGGSELADGEVGALVHVDLANRGSAVVVQTSDLGRRVGPDAFELRGRSPGAEARGCSLAADLWLSGG
ncbi:MAG: acyl-protein synthetase [Gemmatimonadota bacterium]|nr:acyl-protein synthetase [Gemmatimonadota bacterium]